MEKPDYLKWQFPTEAEADEAVQLRNAYQLSRLCPIFQAACIDTCASFFAASAAIVKKSDGEIAYVRVMGGTCLSPLVNGSITYEGPGS